MYLQGFEYSRISNPTRSVLEAGVASLENGKYALCFSSGLAAATAACFLLKAHDQILCIDDVYGGTNALLRNCFAKMSITTTFIDTSNVEEVKQKFYADTALIWLESPSNPTLKLCDIAMISDYVHGINPNVIVLVDNTFASPCFQVKMIDFELRYGSFKAESF